VRPVTLPLEGDGELVADDVLFATGRQPLTDDIGNRAAPARAVAATTEQGSSYIYGPWFRYAALSSHWVGQEGIDQGSWGWITGRAGAPTH
jgi:hypothetical protein